MAVQLTKTSDQKVLAGKLIFQPVADSTAATGITGVASGEFYVVKINNAANSAAVYVKMLDGAAATPGATHPDWIFYAAAGATQEYVMPLGVPYSVGLVLWAVTGAESTGGSSAADPTSSVLVHVVAQ